MLAGSGEQIDQAALQDWVMIQRGLQAEWKLVSG